MSGGNPRKANGARRRSAVRWVKSLGAPCWICGLPIDQGVPAGDPTALEVDELVPVSRGGSPTDRGNVAAAHRCCNCWRSTRSVTEVKAVQRVALERFGPWSSPQGFVERAKALRRGDKEIKGTLRTPGAVPRPTTDW